MKMKIPDTAERETPLCIPETALRETPETLLPRPDIPETPL